MERHGFTVEPNEWWHFNFKDWQEYPILDIPFRQRSASDQRAQGAGSGKTWPETRRTKSS